MTAYVKNVIDTKFLKEKYPDFFKKYQDCLNDLARAYEYNDYSILEYCLWEKNNENIDYEKIDEYYSNFLDNFENLQKKVKKQTGMDLELGYAEDECKNIDGAYFYVTNAFIKNPEINDEVFKEIQTLAIVEDI